jgi:hypothetical protein
MADFNEIRYAHEKEGGNPQPSGCMQAFQDSLSNCNLEEI